MTTPEDPITDLAQGAAQLHEVFLSYVGAGFTETQALELVGRIVHASVGALAQQEWFRK